MRRTVLFFICALFMYSTSQAYAGNQKQDDSCILHANFIDAQSCQKGLTCVPASNNPLSPEGVCVGRGEQGDYCGDSESNSKYCGGDMVCRSDGSGHFVCMGRGNQGDECSWKEDGHGSKNCKGDLVCRDIGNHKWRCVGQGQQNDLCAKEDAGHGSKSCGGNLKCRQSNVNEVYRCIGRGEEGDYCGADDRKHGSPNCQGHLVCRLRDGKYICVKK